MTESEALAAATGLHQIAAQYALDRLHAAGFVIVPREPTREMLSDGRDEIADSIDRTTCSRGFEDYAVAWDAQLRVYRAMLVAAWPSEPAE